jgi:MFS family permease
MTTQAVSVAESADSSVEAQPSLERSYVLWLTNLSHAVNHFQNNMVAALYPTIMAELGFGYFELGTLTAIRTVFGNGSQIVYGFLAPFIHRSQLLGVGNVVMSIGTLATGMVGGFGGFAVARTVASVGASAQHPVGASLLAGHFPRRRGTILALNSSIANIGSLLAPAVAGFLLLVLGWRQIFFVVAILSMAVGAAYFVYRDRLGTQVRPSSARGGLREGRLSYLRVLRNRNIMIISLVQMVGAAGGEGGVNQTYIGPHLVNDLGFNVALAGIALSVFQLGSIVGPLGFGWLSDRWSRKRVIQTSLLLSCLGTLALARQDVIISALSGVWPGIADGTVAVLFINLVLYGGITSSRMTLTQALVADSLTDTDRDAGFSLYYFIAFMSDPVWSLVTGTLMENFGFAFAFSRLSLSYLVGMLLLFFVVDSHRARPVAAV